MGKKVRMHPPYYLIPAYIKIHKMSPQEIAEALGMGERTFHDKVYGFSDFSVTESTIIKTILKADDTIFLTSNVV